MSDMVRLGEEVMALLIVQTHQLQTVICFPIHHGTRITASQSFLSLTHMVPLIAATSVKSSAHRTTSTLVLKKLSFFTKSSIPTSLSKFALDTRQFHFHMHRGGG